MEANKIVELKVKIFDILRNIEVLQNNLNLLVQEKNKLITELLEEESKINQ